ncbi:Alpha-galactosidase OS=Streptomyces rimosus subsp. rimosus (strain ATCC / DSM 40260/ JCM 4667 / NRRL 2234) OX=1265868 GN=SRIM_005705 PE=3 SV=1 [Streptomyces rimosus subsp. rimosus]
MHSSSAPRPPRRTLIGLSTAALCAAGALSATAAFPAAALPATAGEDGARAAAAYPNLAPKPPMGWSNWSYYMCDINEKVILGNARALAKSGLAAKGYDTVTVDDCWMSKQRDARGNLVPDPARIRAAWRTWAANCTGWA